MLEAAAHDLRVARFRITATDAGYAFTVNFDREDILNAVYGSNRGGNQLLGQIEAYIGEHVQIMIDGTPIDYELTKIEFTETNILLSGQLVTALRNIQTLEVRNTCLLSLDGHLNIMEFFLKDKERFFKLDKDRTETTVTY